MEPLWDAITNCQKYLFRFEGLQDYSAEDSDDAVDYFVKTGNLKSIPDANNKWWSDMKLRNENGIVTQRVRLVIEPTTDYTKMELEYLKQAKEYSGDDIRIIKEVDFREVVSNDVSDFYLIDDQKLFIMNYGPKGKYLNSIESDNIDGYIELKEQLLQISIPL